MKKYLLLAILLMSLVAPLTHAAYWNPSSGISVGSATQNTAFYWIDGNRTDTYTPTGNILTPYKTLSSALSAFNAVSSTYSGLVLFITPTASTSPYVEGAPVTFPQQSFALYGNEATIIFASGVTLPGSFDIYDLTIVGDVNETDNSLTYIHQFNNGVILGNLTLAGNGLLSGMAMPKTTSTLQVLQGSLCNVLASFIQGSINVQGILNINDSQVQTGAYNTSTLGWGIYSSSTGAQVIINGMTGIFTAAGLQGGIYVQNGATSSQNILSNFGAIVATSTPGATVNAGTAATVIGGASQMVNALTGAYVAASGTNFQPYITQNEWVMGSRVGGVNIVATSTTLTNQSVEFQVSSSSLWSTTTLPSATSTTGQVFVFKNRGSTTTLITAAGTQSIWFITTNTTGTTYSLLPGSSTKLFSDGIYWNQASK